MSAMNTTSSMMPARQHVPAVRVDHPAATTRPHWPAPGDWWFIAVPVVGAVLGSLLRAGRLPLLVGVAVSAAVVAVVVAAGRMVVPVAARMRPARRLREVRGLVHIWCSGCGCDLDWAPGAFAERHPAPLCASCRRGVDEGRLLRPRVIEAPEAGR